MLRLPAVALRGAGTLLAYTARALGLLLAADAPLLGVWPRLAADVWGRDADALAPLFETALTPVEEDGRDLTGLCGLLDELACWPRTVSNEFELPAPGSHGVKYGAQPK